MHYDLLSTDTTSNFQGHCETSELYLDSAASKKMKACNKNH